jgi:hypothetical protein
MNAITFFFQMARLKHGRSLEYTKVANAQSKAKPEDEEKIWHEHKWEIDSAQHAIQALQTRYYRDIAIHKGIRTEYAEGDWEENINAIGTRIMSVEAIAKLRSAIRQERKELRDMWLPYAAIIISVIALLFSFLNYHKPVTQQIVVPIQPIIMPTATPASHAIPKPISHSRAKTVPH